MKKYCVFLKNDFTMLKIKELRRRKKESQSKLAGITGVSLRTIQNWENGSVDVPFKKLKELAAYFDVSVGDLFNDNNEKIAVKIQHTAAQNPQTPVVHDNPFQVINNKIDKLYELQLQHKDYLEEVGINISNLGLEIIDINDKLKEKEEAEVKLKTTNP